MRSLSNTLSALDPPIKHITEWRGTSMLITLLDPSVPAKVTRLVEDAARTDYGLLNLTLLYAVNELRAKGSHAPLSLDTKLLDD